MKIKHFKIFDEPFDVIFIGVHNFDNIFILKNAFKKRTYALVLDFQAINYENLTIRTDLN